MLLNIKGGHLMGEFRRSIRGDVAQKKRHLYFSRFSPNNKDIRYFLYLRFRQGGDVIKIRELGMTKMI